MNPFEIWSCSHRWISIGSCVLGCDMLLYGSGKGITEVRSVSISRVEGEGLVFLHNADSCFRLYVALQSTKVTYKQRNRFSYLSLPLSDTDTYTLTNTHTHTQNVRIRRDFECGCVLDCGCPVRWRRLSNTDVNNFFRIDSTWDTGRSMPNNIRHMMIKVTGLMFVIYEILSLYHPSLPPAESGAG